jgi:hypothetical protein
MATRPEYSIPPGTAERTRDDLYAQYRLQLDEEAFRRNRARIIDVAARRVDLEAPSSGAGGARAPQFGAAARTGSEPMEQGVSGRSHRSRDSGGAAPVHPPLSYKTDASSGEIRIQPSPYQRGLFVDVII